MKHTKHRLFCLKPLPVLIGAGQTRRWSNRGLAGALMLVSGQLAAANQAVETSIPAMPDVAAADRPAAAASSGKQLSDEQFDLNILKARGLQPELSNYFRQAARFSAGINIIDVVLNGVSIGRKTALFSQTGTLCFTPLFLQSVGLIEGSDSERANNKNGNDNAISKILPISSDQPRTGADATRSNAPPAQLSAFSAQALPDATVCPGPGIVSAQTVVALFPSQVSVDITTPAQTVAIRPIARLEQGGSAAMFNYRASMFTNTVVGGNTNRFTQLDSQAGFNWDDWIIRSNQSYSNQNGQSYMRIANAYAQKTFVEEKQIFQGGLTFTQSPIYGGIPLLGVQWFPETALRSQSRYAVTGIAATRARVIVTQNGVVLLSTVVPPGPFRLTDYQQGNRTGDFQVQVIEATGAEQRFTVASSDILLAEGNIIENGFYAAAGLLSNVGGVSGQRSVPMLTLEKGWRYIGKTAFSTGGLVTNKYVSAGAAVTSQAEVLGPVSVSAQTQVAHDMRDGATGMLVSSSLGWRYLEQLQIGASAVARTARYRSAQEAQVVPLFGSPLVATHFQMGANIGWNAGRIGSFTASATRQILFAAPASNTYAVSWNTAVGKGQLGVTLARTQQSAVANLATRLFNNSLFVTFYMPLGFDATLTSNFQQTNSSGVSRSVATSNISQRLNDTLSYQASVEKSLSETSGDTKSISINAVPRYTSITVGAGSGLNTNNYFAQASGGVIINSDGASFAPSPIQDTFAVVKLGDVSGVKLSTPQGIVWSGFNGLTAVPGLTPFTTSTVEVVTTSLPLDVDIDQAMQVVQAVRGAVVNMEMKVNRVQRVLLTVTHSGNMLPERAPVVSEDGELVAVSTQDGRIVMNDFKPTSTYTVRLPDGTSCKLGNIKLGNPGVNSIFQTGVAVCQ